MLTQLPEWQALINHQQEINSVHMRDLFQQDPQRFEKFSTNAAELFLDFSKNRINEKTISLLVQLADKIKLHEKISALFQGEKINFTEHRPALHTALRNRSNQAIVVDGKDVMPSVNNTLQKMQQFCDKIHNHEWRGFSNQPITDIVNLGIGGSDLGPCFATHALTEYKNTALNFHFISSIDQAHFSSVLQQLNPEKTLFIISSKSFSTYETLHNATAAKQWLSNNQVNEKDFGKHFIAITNNFEKAQKFGVTQENIFSIPEWVGGRYSLWSAIGLPIALSIGMENFLQLLDGAYAMDQHFQQSDLKQNMPVILALLSIWYSNFFAAQTHAILPYSYLLREFPAYLQQLVMESNGKHVDAHNKNIDYTTSPIIFGEIGTLGQHSFHQLLHQGTCLIPADFIVPMNDDPAAIVLLANALAQSKTLMQGKTLAEVTNELQQQNLTTESIQQLAAHKVLEGNQPSNTILLKSLTPFNLGALIALYEHKTFVQSAIWNINAFDQWGVECGKQLADKILPDLVNANSNLSHDSSTNGLIGRFRGTKKN